MVLLIYALRQSQSEPVRASQSHPKSPRAGKSHPRITQSQLEPARAS